MFSYSILYNRNDEINTIHKRKITSVLFGLFLDFQIALKLSLYFYLDIETFHQIYFYLFLKFGRFLAIKAAIPSF